MVSEGIRIPASVAIAIIRSRGESYGLARLYCSTSESPRSPTNIRTRSRKAASSIDSIHGASAKKRVISSLFVPIIKGTCDEIAGATGANGPAGRLVPSITGLKPTRLTRRRRICAAFGTREEKRCRDGKNSSAFVAGRTEDHLADCQLLRVPERAHERRFSQRTFDSDPHD